MIKAGYGIAILPPPHGINVRTEEGRMALKMTSGQTLDQYVVAEIRKREQRARHQNWARWTMFSANGGQLCDPTKRTELFPPDAWRYALTRNCFPIVDFPLDPTQPSGVLFVTAMWHEYSPTAPYPGFHWRRWVASTLFSLPDDMLVGIFEYK